MSWWMKATPPLCSSTRTNILWTKILGISISRCSRCRISRSLRCSYRAGKRSVGSWMKVARVSCSREVLKKVWWWQEEDRTSLVSSTSLLLKTTISTLPKWWINININSSSRASNRTNTNMSTQSWNRASRTAKTTSTPRTKAQFRPLFNKTALGWARSQGVRTASTVYLTTTSKSWLYIITISSRTPRVWVQISQVRLNSLTSLVVLCITGRICIPPSSWTLNSKPAVSSSSSRNFQANLASTKTTQVSFISTKTLTSISRTSHSLTTNLPPWNRLKFSIVKRSRPSETERPTLRSLKITPITPITQTTPTTLTLWTTSRGLRTGKRNRWPNQG
jgi:hypothetical protein